MCNNGNRLDFNSLLGGKCLRQLQQLLTWVPATITQQHVLKLLFWLKDRQKVRNIILLSLCNHLVNNYKEYLDFSTTAEIPLLEINSHYLAVHGFPFHYNHSKLIRLAGEIFVNSDFKMLPEEILEKLKSDYAFACVDNF
jgi:hypothetical protein